MTEPMPTIEPERIKWSDRPYGCQAGRSSDERLFVSQFATIETGPESEKWYVVDITIGTARVYQRATGLYQTMFEQKNHIVIGKGWRYDTAFLSLWVSPDMVNCHWWVTRRDETALARGTCFGFDAAVEEARQAAVVELEKCRQQLLDVPALVVAPAKKEKVAA